MIHVGLCIFEKTSSFVSRLVFGFYSMMEQMRVTGSFAAMQSLLSADALAAREEREE